MVIYLPDAFSPILHELRDILNKELASTNGGHDVRPWTMAELVGSAVIDRWNNTVGHRRLTPDYVKGPRGRYIVKLTIKEPQNG